MVAEKIRLLIGGGSSLPARSRRMKLLAISDHYIPLRLHAAGPAAAWRSWACGARCAAGNTPHWSSCKQANLAIEQGGPDAVELPPELMRDVGRC